MIDGNTINKSKSTRFLGITIDENLTWNEHVQNIISKILTNKRLLVNVCNLLTSYAMKNIYYAHIYSHLDLWTSGLGQYDGKKFFKMTSIKYKKIV